MGKKFIFNSILQIFLAVTIWGCEQEKKTTSLKTTFSTDTISKDTTKNATAFSILESPLEEEAKDSQTPWWHERLALLNVGMGEFGKYTFKKETKLNDSLSYLVLGLNDGICNFEYLATYLNKEEIEFVELAKGCDLDLSVPVSKWIACEFESQTSFIVKHFIEKVHDSLIAPDGYIVNGIDFIEAETTIDSTETKFTILPNGTIKKVQ